MTSLAQRKANKKYYETHILEIIEKRRNKIKEKNNE